MMYKTKTRFSGVGLVLGAIAFLVAAIDFWVGPFASESTFKEVATEQVSSLKGQLIAKITGDKTDPIPLQTDALNIDKIIDIGLVVLASLAIILGIVGFAMKEPIQAMVGCVVLGVGAMAFKFLFIALVIAILIVIVVTALNNL